MWNGSKYTFCLFVILLLMACFGKTYWNYYETIQLSLIDQTHAVLPQYLLKQTLILFQSDWEKRLVKDFDYFYLSDKNCSFEVNNPEYVYKRLVKGTISGLELSMFFGQNDSETWIDETYLREHLEMKKLPERVSNSYEHKVVKRERGMLIKTSHIYRISENELFFIVRLGLRDYGLNQAGLIVEELTEPHGSQFPYQYFIWVEKKGLSFVRNVSM